MKSCALRRQPVYSSTGPICWPAARPPAQPPAQRWPGQGQVVVHERLLRWQPARAASSWQPCAHAGCGAEDEGSGPGPTLSAQGRQLLQEAPEGGQAGAGAHHDHRPLLLHRQPEGGPAQRGAACCKALGQRVRRRQAGAGQWRPPTVRAGAARAWPCGQAQPGALLRRPRLGAHLRMKRGTWLPTRRRLRYCEHTPTCCLPVAVVSSTYAQVTCTAVGCARGELEME